MPRWRDIAFTLNESDASKVAEAWRWLVPDWQRLLLCSMIGGLFIERSDRAVHWLESGTGLIEPVASSATEFKELMRTQNTGITDEVWEWFMPPLVERLHEAGKIPEPGQCYGFTILPVFEGGAFDVPNMFVLPAVEWLTFSADVHHQLRDIPDSDQVQLKVVD